MYRLIVWLEWTLGTIFVALAALVFVLKVRLFPDDGLVVLVLAVVLTLLFFVGAFVAPEEQRTLANLRPYPYHRDLFLLAATFGGLGLIFILAGESWCGERSRSLCTALRLVARPLGFEDIDLAISVVSLLIGVFFAIYGFKFYRSRN